MMLRLLSLV